MENTEREREVRQRRRDPVSCDGPPVQERSLASDEDNETLSPNDRRSSTSDTDTGVDEGDSGRAILNWAWRRWKHVSFEALPEWLKDNEYLLHGHRPPLPSIRACIKSMFRLHTETWNIWTHLLGMVLFLFVALCLFLFQMSESISSVPWYEKLVIGAFFLGVVLCLSCSFLFHMLNCHSPHVAHLFSRLDYSGIALLVTGSSIPFYYYSYYCAQFSRYLHMTIVVVLCILCMCVSLWSKFSHPKYRPLRALMFVLFGLYGVIPGVEVIVRDGWKIATDAYSGWWLISMGLIYIAGAGLYVARVPERFFPGKFDICLHSHQLFHVCVVIAAWVHYDGILNMVNYRLSVGVECLAPLP